MEGYRIRSGADLFGAVLFGSLAPNQPGDMITSRVFFFFYESIIVM